MLLWVVQTTPLATSSEAIRNGFLEPSSGRNLPFDGWASVAVEKVSRERQSLLPEISPPDLGVTCSARGCGP